MSTRCLGSVTPLPVNLKDRISPPQTGLLRRRARGYTGDHHLAAHQLVVGKHEQHGEDHDRHHKIHEGPGDQDYRPFPAVLAGEAVGIGGILFSHHLDEAAQGDEVEGVHRVPVSKAEDTRWKSKPELRNPDPEPLGGHKVPPARGRISGIPEREL